MQENVCVAEKKPPPTYYICTQPLPPFFPNIHTEIHRDKQFTFRHHLVTAHFSVETLIVLSSNKAMSESIERKSAQNKTATCHSMNLWLPTF